MVLTFKDLINDVFCKSTNDADANANALFFNPMMMQGNNGSNPQLNPDSAAMFQQQIQQMQQMQQFLQLMQNLYNQPQSQPLQQYNNEQQPQSGSPYTPSNSNHASKRILI